MKRQLVTFLRVIHSERFLATHYSYSPCLRNLQIKKSYRPLPIKIMAYCLTQVRLSLHAALKKIMEKLEELDHLLKKLLRL